MTMQVRIRTGSITGCFGLLAIMSVAIPSGAGTTSAAPVAGVLPDATADALMILLPPRPIETIRTDIDMAESSDRDAAADRTAAEERLNEAKAAIMVCTSEIDVLKARVKLAKEQENATEQADLERQIKVKQLQLKALEARRDMREGERDVADARRTSAQALNEFLKRELELIGRRDELVKMTTSGEQAADPGVLARFQIDVRALERRCLERLKDVAERQRDTANREKELVDARLTLHEAQRASLAGPK